jgi:uncharacterized protein YndB with AHSA1/START domain
MTAHVTQTTMEASPEAIMALLTEPDAIARWAPVPFEVEDISGRRLKAGSRARVSGRLAGKRVGFDVDVLDAGDGRLALTASGPVSMDVEYVIRPVDDGSEVSATVAVREGRGLGGRLLAQATGALLSGGALQSALGRMASEVATV